MKNNVKLKLWSLFGIFFMILLFITLSYFVQTNLDFFERLISDNFLGLVIYIVLNIIGIVLAPVTVIPLIIVVTGIWGWVIAGIVTWVAWVLGAIIAFWIARRFGVPIVGKFISLKELYKFEDRFSFISKFWGVVFLRMVIPVEILSYGLGLFSRINFWKYTFASALGLLPVSFLFGYFGEIPFTYQIIIGLCVLIAILVMMIFQEIRQRQHC